MENRNYRGSEWRKWDLHIHSNASDGDCSPEEIIVKAKELDLSVIALTDHHTAKNIDSIKEIGNSEGITVISGIEFRSEYGEKSVHFIGLFPDVYNGTVLNSRALHDLILCPLGLSETRIIGLGKETNTGFNDNQAFKDGMFKVQVDLKTAANLIHKYGGLVTVHNGSKNNGLDDQMKHQGAGPRNVSDLYDCLGTVKEDLLVNYIDICEIRKSNDSEAFYLERFNKPSIIASDAHAKNEIGQKSVWIKADKTFEGLKQIIYEPAERVKIQVEKPEQKNDYNIIESVHINHKDFNNQTIPLNQNLNTIIGGRSSGKSILLGSIAKKIGTDRNVKEKNKSYEQYIEEQLLPAMTINWKDGIGNALRNIEYFPQSYINNLAATSNDINNLIENTIKNDEDKKRIIDQYIAFCIENKSTINQEISNYFSLKEKITERKQDIKSHGSKEGVEKQIDKIKNEIDLIKTSMKQDISEDDEKKYKEFQSNLEEIASADSKSDTFIKQIQELKSIKIINDISADLLGLEDSVRDRIANAFNGLKSTFENNFFSELDSIISAENDKIQRRKELTINIENDEIFKKCVANFNQNAVYHESVKKLQVEESKLNQIISLENDIQTIESKIELKFATIINSHDRYFVKANELIQSLMYSKDNVEISAYPTFKVNNFREILGVRFNQKSYEIQNLVNFDYTSHQDYMGFISGLFHKIESDKVPLKGSYNKQQVIIDIFAENSYKIEYDVLYQGDNLSSMSEGKKAFIILRILLDFNDKECPILIDQPEDDLDNRAIYDQLVEYLRKKKKERQIIIVTHNPNIVVGADAEEVIVANQNGVGTMNQENVKFEYLTGALENTAQKISTLPVLIGQGIKQHVCDVLEGGNEAFLKRELKYGIIQKS